MSKKQRALAEIKRLGLTQFDRALTSILNAGVELPTATALGPVDTADIQDNAVTTAKLADIAATTNPVVLGRITGTGDPELLQVLDEDTMVSNSATALATQQSIKAYVDAATFTNDLPYEIYSTVRKASNYLEAGTSGLFSRYVGFDSVDTSGDSPILFILDVDATNGYAALDTTDGFAIKADFGKIITAVVVNKGESNIVLTNLTFTDDSIYSTSLQGNTWRRFAINTLGQWTVTASGTLSGSVDDTIKIVGYKLTAPEIIASTTPFTVINTTNDGADTFKVIHGITFKYKYVAQFTGTGQTFAVKLGTTTVATFTDTQIGLDGTADAVAYIPVAAYTTTQKDVNITIENTGTALAGGAGSTLNVLVHYTTFL